MEKKLDGNYTRMLLEILNRSWQQHPTRRQLYGHLPPITKTVQARPTRHTGHCWRSKDEIVRDVHLWTPAYGQSKAGRPARTYIQQLCDDTGCNPEDMPEAMNDRETWRERVRDIRASRTSWWWWLFKHLLIKIHQNIFVQEKKRQWIYDLLSAKTKSKEISEIIRISLCPGLNPLDYAIWSILENKTNAISHQNIGSLKTAIEEESNKIAEKFILKSFRRRVDTITEQWWPYWVNLLFYVYLLILMFIFRINMNLVLL